MSNFRQFFEGSDGTLSMMRLLSFMALIGFIPLCYLRPEQASHWVTVIVCALTFKWAQKSRENKKDIE